jgi:nitrite reductase/ring-hydroxylating ferredoxin subunit
VSRIQINVSHLKERLGVPVFLDELRDEVVLVNQEGTWRLFSTICPHFGGPLVVLSDDEFRCYWHDWKFSSRTGECLNRKSGLRIREYSLIESIEDGALWAIAIQ